MTGSGCRRHHLPLGHNRPKGSPAGALREVQDAFAGELLAAQVEMLDPGLVILVCGRDYWQSARKPAQLESLRPLPRPLIAGGIVDGRAWLIGYRPGGASHAGTGAYAYADLVARAVSDLRTKKPG